MKTVSSEFKPAADGGGPKTKEAWRRAFGLCVDKTRANIQRLADEPKAAPWAADGNYFAHPEGFYEIGNWTSSFFTGMALLAWRETEDEFFLQQALRLAPHYREKVFKRYIDTHHDLGFLYSLYSVALHKLTGDQAHRAAGLRAAEVLHQRFNPKGGFIRAWGHMNTTEHDNLAIIDCLMNLPLLHWASRESGDPKFRSAAVRQADTTLQQFIRADDSVFHAYRFDLQTGRPLGGDNYCGYAVDSHWARGTGWAVYGFAMSYRFTGDRKYLDASLRLARKFHQCLNGDAVPVWDFKLADGAPRIPDSSASAIVVCGLQELAQHAAADAELLRLKDRLLDRICRDDFLDFSSACPGILRQAQINPRGPGTAASVFTSWGDYFLMEALARELFKTEPFW